MAVEPVEIYIDGKLYTVDSYKAWNQHSGYEFYGLMTFADDGYIYSTDGIKQFVDANRNPVKGTDIPNIDGANYYFVVVGSVSLPGGYTRLEYVQSDGAAYINTGFKPNQNTKVVIDFLSTHGSEGNFGSVFGAQVGWGSNSYSLGTYTVSYGASAVGTLKLNDGNRHHAELYDGYLYSDGKLIWTAARPQTFQLTCNMYLFGNNEKDTTLYPSKAQIYSCKIYDNGTLVRDYIPAKNNAGTIGMYDDVSGTFYANAGAGSFMSGREFYDDISELTRLEYIESSGTQYIDTGFTPSNNTRVVAEVETVISLSANKWIFGQRSNSNTQRYEVIYIASANEIRFYVNTSNYTFPGVQLGRLSIDVSASSATINGVSVNPSVADFNGARTLYICDCNSNAVSNEAIGQRVYNFKIYDNGTLIRDYIPAKNKSGVAGLYDQVSHMFYTNAGTGVFTAGSFQHTTVIDSTLHSIKAGKVLVDSTGYSIFRGRTLANGTAYNISFAEVIPPPSQSGSLTYTGRTLTPSWSNYDSAVMTIGGTTSAINAGTYTATFTPNDGFAWNDGSTDAKSINWTIAKAPGSIYLSKTNISISGTGKTDTFTIQKSSDGAVSVKSSNTSKVTVSYSSPTVTVRSVATGSATITVTVAEGTNHLSVSKTCSVSVTAPKQYKITITDKSEGDAYIKIDGVKQTNGTFYTQSETITCHIYGYNQYSYVKVDGTVVYSIPYGGERWETYTYTLKKDITVNLLLEVVSAGSLRYYVGAIEIET